MKLEFVRKMDEGRGLMELYKRGEEYIVVSTITEEQRPTDPLQRGWVELTAVMSMFTEDEPLPAHGEETMAFEADEDGYVTQHYPHLAAAFGDGSREKVIKQLQECE